MYVLCVCIYMYMFTQFYCICKEGYCIIVCNQLANCFTDVTHPLSPAT